MKNKTGIKLGVAWYREDQWQLLKSTASDAENIEDTYQEWLQSAEKAMKRLEKQGFKPGKVDLNVKEFNGWCEREGRIPNAGSRSEYTAELLRIRNKEKWGGG